MWFLGLEVSITELLAIFSGLVVLCIVYLSYEIYKLKRIEARLERVERRFEKDEDELEESVEKLGRAKKKK
jgi:biopolymer transport protein ExbB/TolQ